MLNCIIFGDPSIKGSPLMIKFKPKPLTVKKNIIQLVFLLTALIFADSHAQTKARTLKCHYKLTYQANKQDTFSIETEKMVLYTDNYNSKFASVNHLLYEDSLKWVLVESFERTGRLDGSISIPQTFFKWEIFKTPKHLEVFDNVLTQIYFYKEDRNEMSWNISQETAIISDFQCQKATGHYGGRNYVAWFTTEIPISDGPYKFSGLPGLIVKVYDTENHYIWELSGIEENFKYDFKTRPEDFVKSSKKEVLKMRLMQSQNPGLYLDQLGAFGDEHKRMYIEKYSKRNNPIELE